MRVREPKLLSLAQTAAAVGHRMQSRAPSVNHRSLQYDAAPAGGKQHFSPAKKQFLRAISFSLNVLTFQFHPFDSSRENESNG